MKYRINPQIGRVKHSVSFHDGVQTHKDGSPFYGIEIFRTAKQKAAFVRELEAQGYRPA